MAGPAPGPPDLISDMVQPVDLVNSVQRPAVVLAMANGDSEREAVMPVCGQIVLSATKMRLWLHPVNIVSVPSKYTQLIKFDG